MVQICHLHFKNKTFVKYEIILHTFVIYIFNIQKISKINVFPSEYEQIILDHIFF